MLELTITRVDDQNLDYGMLCHIWDYLGVTYVWDLGTGPATAATPEISRGSRLSIDFAFNDTEYTFFRVGSSTLGLHLKRRGTLHKLRLNRTDSSDAPCVSRVQLPPSPR